MNKLFIVSIDVGSTNFAYSVGECNSDYSNLKILDGQVLDITIMHESTEEESQCTLNHKKCSSNWVEHFIATKELEFDRCDQILIECQPYTGLKDIEQLLYDKYKSKAILCQPRTIHAKYHVAGNHIKDLDERREWRKKQVTKIAKKMLDSRLTQLMDEYSHPDWEKDRCQHLGDSVVQMMWWTDHKHEEFKKQQNRIRLSTRVVEGWGTNFVELTERFKYVPNK